MLALSFKFLGFLIILYTVNAKIFVNIDSDGENSILGSYFYSESQFRNYTYEVRSINHENQLMQRKLDALHLKMNKEMGSQMSQLIEIQKMLEQRVKKGSTKKAPTSCAEAMQSKTDLTHGGVYRLHLPDLPPFEVFCLKDPDNGAAWTIIQRRQDGTMDFYLKWIDYKTGFGNLYDEFWLGLDKIHALTKVAKQELWIFLEDFDGEFRHARYSAFAIGDARSKYVMHTLGTYSGDAGDALHYHFNSKFSTKDSDNDNDPTTSCASKYFGAWWFNKCFHCDLNGKYLRNGVDAAVKKAEGIDWYLWRGHFYSLKHVHMAIRPVM